MDYDPRVNEALRRAAEKPPYDPQIYEARQIYARRGLRWLLCFFWIHDMRPVVELRPWTATNFVSRTTIECARCGKLWPTWR